MAKDCNSAFLKESTVGRFVLALFDTCEAKGAHFVSPARPHSRFAFYEKLICMSRFVIIDCLLNIGVSLLFASDHEHALKQISQIPLL